MSKSTRSRSILATLVLGAGLLFFVQPVQAAATLSCLPPSGNADRFTITPGEAVAFACTVRSEEASSAFLLGTLTSGDGSTSAAGSDAALEGGTPLDVTLSFPALFQPGSYRFAFTLFDKATKKPLSEEVVLTGTVGGDKRASIAATSLDREQYEWQDPFVLSVTLDIPEDQDANTDTFLLRVALQDAAGEDCADLAGDLRLMSHSQKISLDFPEQGTCRNSLALSLRDGQGTLLDEKTIAVGFPETSTSVAVPTGEGAAESTGLFASIPRLLLVFLGITGIFLLALMGYFFIRRRRGY